MSARDAILGRIRGNLGRDGTGESAADERLARHQVGPRPKRTELPHPDQVDLFSTMAAEVDATVARCEKPRRGAGGGGRVFDCAQPACAPGRRA